MSLTSFPDILGPIEIGTGTELDALIRRGQLNILGSGVTATDNAARRRTDLTLADATFVAVTGSFGSSGEWQPAVAGTENADLVRVSSSTSGTLLTGADFSGQQIKLTKFFANVGSNQILMQPPASVIAGHAYFANSFTLRANETVRAVWDDVSLVYRIQSAAAAPLADRIIINGVFVTVGGDHILKP